NGARGREEKHRTASRSRASLKSAGGITASGAGWKGSEKAREEAKLRCVETRSVDSHLRERLGSAGQWLCADAQRRIAVFQARRVCLRGNLQDDASPRTAGRQHCCEEGAAQPFLPFWQRCWRAPFLSVCSFSSPLSAGVCPHNPLAFGVDGLLQKAAFRRRQLVSKATAFSGGVHCKGGAELVGVERQVGADSWLRRRRMDELEEATNWHVLNLINC
ncbi:unnamed protein product, partial [Phaeothamnion confervicola]